MIYIDIILTGERGANPRQSIAVTWYSKYDIEVESI